MIKVPLTDCITAFEGIIGDLESSLEESRAQIRPIKYTYNLERPIAQAMQTKNTDDLTIPTYQKLEQISKYSRTDVQAGHDGIVYSFLTSYTLDELSEKLGEVDKKIKEAQEKLEQRAQQIDTSPALGFLGFIKPLKKVIAETPALSFQKPWKIKDNQERQRSVDYYSGEIESLSKERDRFQDAHDKLHAEVEQKKTSHEETAAADLQILKKSLGTVIDVEAALPAARELLEDMKKERQVGITQNMLWAINPAEIGMPELKRMITEKMEPIKEWLWQARKRNAQEQKDENIQHNMNEVLNGLNLDDVATHAKRNTPFECVIQQPTLESFYTEKTATVREQETSDPRREPQPWTIRYNLVDPSLMYTHDKKPVTVFNANLFWYPEKKMLGIETVHTREDLQDSGVGRVAVRNIFDLARSLGAERIDLLAGKNAGPYFWAKAGAALQPENVDVSIGMMGMDSETYGGGDSTLRRIKWALEYRKERGRISDEDYNAGMAVVNTSSPEQALWWLADSKPKGVTAKTDASDGDSVFHYLMCKFYSKDASLKYAARFELNPERAVPGQTERMDSYLPPNLAVDTGRYEASRETAVRKSKNYLTLHQRSEGPSPVFQETASLK